MGENLDKDLNSKISSEQIKGDNLYGKQTVKIITLKIWKTMSAKFSRKN